VGGDTGTVLAQAGMLPPELKARLSERWDLVDVAAMAGGRETCRVLVTTSMTGADAALMDSLPALGFIACNGAGLEKIDMAHAAGRGIEVLNTPDAVTTDTADFGLALTLALARRVAEGDRFVRSGRWGAERMTPSVRVRGKLLGVVGLGKIGQTLAARAEALGLRIAYTGPRRKAGVVYDYHPDANALARACDFLVLTCPGTAETEGLIDASVLAALGPHGYLINIARGSVVDEPALIAALTDRRIAGAALDVFAREPLADSPLLALENVILAPHYAAVTGETRADMAEILNSGISRFLGGTDG